MYLNSAVLRRTTVSIDLTPYLKLRDSFDNFAGGREDMRKAASRARLLLV